jgi:hypothetical protein
MNMMTRYLAGVLTVIAAGVLAIAYSLTFARATSMPMGGLATPAVAASVDAWGQPSPEMWANAASSDRMLRGASGPRAATAQRFDVEPRFVSDEPVALRPTRAIRVVEVDEPVRVTRRATRVVDRPRRDWKRTAMIIGGTTAASAGVGGIVGGKKGALIGAAIGGGASTIYETTKSR